MNLANNALKRGDRITPPLRQAGVSDKSNIGKECDEVSGIFIERYFIIAREIVDRCDNGVSSEVFGELVN